MEGSIYETRKSIRKFTGEPLSNEDVLDILDAGRIAPSAKNRQPWRFIVYKNEEKKKLLQAMEVGISQQEKSIFMPKKAKKGLSSAKNTKRIMDEADVIILVVNVNGSSPFKPVVAHKRITEILDAQSIGACFENMCLRATEKGIGSLWIGNTFHAYKALCDFAGISKKEQLAGALALGIPAESPAGRPRKNLGDLYEIRG